MYHLKKQLISALLACAMVSSGLPGGMQHAYAASDSNSDTSIGWSSTGTIGVTLRFDRVQKMSNLQERNITATILQNDVALIALPLGTGNATSGSYTATGTLRDTDGGTLGGGQYPGYADFAFTGLLPGTYTLRLSGDGFKTYNETVELQNYSKQIIIGTGDATFTLGDFDSDGNVSQEDWNSVAEDVLVGSSTTNTLYDLNGDGVVDVTDVAYVGRMQNATGDASVLNTTVISSANLMEVDYATAGIEPEQVQQLLQGTSSVDLPVNKDTGMATIPIVFQEPVQMEQVNITTPSTGTAQAQKGTVTVETEDGQTLAFPFDQTAPAQVYATSTRSGSSVITISLGNRVAVKKITVTVEQNESGEYIAVQSIEFLQDIVPETPVSVNNQVKKISITAGDASAKLTWTALPNISSYVVRYKVKDSTAAYTEKTVTAATATISDLKNNTTYVFTVTPADDGLIAVESSPVEATPKAAEAPLKPSISGVKAGDGTLVVNWVAAKEATYYQVFTSTQANTGYVQVGGNITGTSATLTDLTNDVTYYITVKAGNGVGLSPSSGYATGTPFKLMVDEPAGIPTAGRLPAEKIASVSLTDSKNWMSGELALNKSINSVKDGNYSTGWTAKADGSNKEIVFTFTEPVDIGRVIWVPRRDNANINYGSYLNTYAIKAYSSKYPGGVYIAPSTLTDYTVPASGYLSVQSDPTNSGFATLPLTAIGGITKVAITVLPNKSANPITLSEVIFLLYDKEAALDAQISNLFADSTYTTLKSEVTLDQLNDLQARVNSDEIKQYSDTDVMQAELSTAFGIFNGEDTGAVKTDMLLRNIGDDSFNYSQSGSELIPLGITAAPKAKLAVYVEGLQNNEQMELYATQNYAEVNSWIDRAGYLKNGRNIITIPKVSSNGSVFGGSLYINDSVLLDTNPANVKIRVIPVTDGDIVEIPVLDLEHWYTMDDTARRAAISTYVTELTAYAKTLDTSNTLLYTNVTEISMPSVLLSIPALTVYNRIKNDTNAVETLYQNTLAWEEITYLTNYTQGIEKRALDSSYDGSPLTTRQNIRSMTMFGGAFMYAAGSHIGVGYNSTGSLVNGVPTSKMASGATENSLFGWGIGHEIGHNMDKLGKVEVTNNLFSLMAQTYDGKENVLSSRLENSDLYPTIFSRTAQAVGGDAGSVFVQLGLYWQLHLAYDDGSNPMDFYNRFFTAWKSNKYTAGLTSYDDKLAVTASAVAGKDLTEFFTRWGKQLSDAAKAKMSAYAPETRAIWYLSDQSRRDRLTGASAASGTISSLTSSVSEKNVTLNWTASITGDVQGYEILRDGKSVDFVTTATTFTDTIPLSNHRNFSYTVKAYDHFGNVIATSSESVVRIAYDNTVDASQYTIERDNDTGDVHITFIDETPISGFKISGSSTPTSGVFTATVTTTQDGETKDIVAKEGDFTKNEAVDDASSYLTYFNKPNTTDTRIWTYDANKLVISGIPAAVSLDDIAVLGYVGDDIGFYNDANNGVAIGRLGKDLVIGAKTIKKGTLVAVGTYRGDPVYNTIEIEGKFQSTHLDANGVQTVTEVTRAMDGDIYLYAEIPEDGQVSTISDGLFIFVPNEQNEHALQNNGCDGDMLLPTTMKAVLYRTATPGDASSKRMTAETSWIFSPNGDQLPTIVIE